MDGEEKGEGNEVEGDPEEGVGEKGVQKCVDVKVRGIYL